MRSAFVYTAEGRLNTKSQRQRDLLKTKFTLAPESYKSNNTKEELCLEYINTFIEQFSNIYKKRRIPFMVAENEFGVRKFVCSTLRPTQVPVPELYDLYECASFLAGYNLYEPLDPATETPKYLFSPLQVLESNTGDSFDLSNLLCSFLLGAGYDAYVVHGYAPKFITLKDQSMTQCPMISDTSESVKIKQSKDNNNSTETQSSNYIPPDNTVKSSQYIANLAEKKRLESIDKFQLWIPDPPVDESRMMEDQKNKSLADQRVHAWVLVRSGRRDIKEHVFVEASTGRVYATKNSPYIAIEAVWNHTNFFINKKIETKASEMDFSFPANEEDWEGLFITSLKSKSPGNAQKHMGDNGHNMEEDDDHLMHHNKHSSEESKQAASNLLGEENVRYFDAPVTWSQPLSLSRSQYLLQYPPSGKRTIQYHCAKVDFFAKNTHEQSMVMRISHYLDAKCTIVKEIHEWFENRVDHLYKRIRSFLGDRKFVEFFTPGSRGEVKKWTEYPGKSIEIDYYVDGRLDRLLRREETIGQNIIEYFEGRTDFMITRSVLLSIDQGSLGSTRQFQLPTTNDLNLELSIVRMTQTFEKNPAISEREEKSPITLGGNKGSDKPASQSSNNSNNTNNASNTLQRAGGGGHGANNPSNSAASGGGGVVPILTDGENISKRIFNVREGKAVFYYHFKKSQITGKVKTYLHTRGPTIPVLSDQAAAQEVGLDEDSDALQEVAALERECFSSIKASYVMHDKLVMSRLDGEIRVKSEKTVFDKALDSVDYQISSTQSHRDAFYQAEAKGTDFLTPFLKNVGDPNHLLREEALSIRQACLDALKARLVERANIIQTKLHEENAKLGKKQELFQRSQREGDFSTEEYEKYCTEAMFRIQILEQRLAAHEEAALRKFADLDVKLSNDPRLKVLKS